MKRTLYRLPIFFGCASLVCIFYGSTNHWSVLRNQFDTLLTQIDINLPKNFGKTHFIIGQSEEQRARHMSQQTPYEQLSSESAVYFSPDDDVRSILLDMIAREHNRIAIAVFAFTDHTIAQGLIDAHKRGVRVELITDPASLRDVHNKIGMLCDAGVPVYVYNARGAQRGLSSTMHHKFALFGVHNEASLVWTGSCNFTRSAYESNQENAVVLSGEFFIAKFATQFDRLKQRSYRYKKEG
jgi:cardiolipin hydrolase